MCFYVQKVLDDLQRAVERVCCRILLVALRVLVNKDAPMDRLLIPNRRALEAPLFKSSEALIPLATRPLVDASIASEIPSTS